MFLMFLIAKCFLKNKFPKKYHFKVINKKCRILKDNLTKDEIATKQVQGYYVLTSVFDQDPFASSYYFLGPGSMFQPFKYHCLGYLLLRTTSYLLHTMQERHTFRTFSLTKQNKSFISQKEN